MSKELKLAFIGGGNMASALAAGLIGKRCGAHDVHIIDPNEQVRGQWTAQGATAAAQADQTLSGQHVWIFAVKPQYLKQAVESCRPYLAVDTLVISVAAGISTGTLAQWLGTADQPWTRLIRCMPNTPALIGAGATGLLALDGVSEDDRAIAQQMLRAVGEVVWVDDDAGIDAVTALSGSGPAYVFLFLESLIQGGVEQGLAPDVARKLALATVTGATQLAGLSSEDLVTLRERVTSKGGTTAAALDVFNQEGFGAIVRQAMKAARERAAELSTEFSG
ncbi:pyrroline-5-carboxylate reductase [Allopusillimonas ginsengisoli]|uniref:pyrroline-5-carboxylate reductase n=1 Tax=Allopusillimonas ginsengisoli TaxID=453575 RepID=UPI00102104E4|nr:pyrroline-5-carboxylate reductase [Allopusillimonas ginsengisoli]TEA72295.1 pyrroline-5-carboxylate reductase [Allopusillimonas ginsengisoli]